MVKKFILLIALYLEFSCGLVNESSKKRIVNPIITTGYNFKTNGYYYHISSNNLHLTYTILFLYKNGKALILPNNNFTEGLSRGEEKFSSKEFLGNIYDTITPITRILWTNYFIVGDSIGVEQILPERSYPHYILTGTIINDSTFFIEKRIGVYNLTITEQKVIELNDTFHFRKFHFKPDSSLTIVSNTK